MNYLILFSLSLFLVIVCGIMYLQQRDQKRREEAKSLLRQFTYLIENCITLEELTTIWNELDSSTLKEKSSRSEAFVYTVHSSYVPRFKDLRTRLQAKYNLLKIKP